MGKTAYVSFRAGELEGQLQARDHESSLGLTAKRDLERYYTLLEDELATVDLTPPEARMLCEALKGDTIGGSRYRTLLWASVMEVTYLPIFGSHSRVKKQHQDQLAEKLRKLRPGQAMALIDAVERFWRQPNARDVIDPEPHDEVESVKALVRVGLVRENWIEEIENWFGEWEQEERKRWEAEQAQG
jgi:hypothetical protein